MIAFIRYKLLELTPWDPKGNTVSRGVKTIPTTDVTSFTDSAWLSLIGPFFETLLGLCLGEFSATLISQVA